MRNINLIKPALCLMTLVATVIAADPPLKKGCPEPIDVQPCKCESGQYTVLQCNHVEDTQVLRNVFQNSTKYAFREVHIQFSVLQYLPYEIFEKVPVKFLYLKNTTLIQLFDEPPQSLDALDTLHLENTKLMRGIVWRLLEPLTRLRILTVYYNSIKTLGQDFSKYATKELEQLTFYATDTKSIKPGTLVDFVKLNKVAIENCKLTSLTRDIFPNPFDVRVLHFNNNKLTTIPDDLFSNMPELQTVGLRFNQITVIPATAFQGSFLKIEWLMLDGNPIMCDCRLWWLIRNKPPALSGKCALPTALQGKDIKDVDVDYFQCY